MKKFIKEFKEFIQRGNVLDLAIGIIIGTAFNKIVSSLVNDIIMPLVGLIGGTNVKEANFVLVDAVYATDGVTILKSAVTLNYGSFIQYVIDFFIIALTVFVIMKVVKRLQSKADKAKEKIIKDIEAKIGEQPAPVVEEVVEEPVIEPQPTTEELLTEIRDLLAQSNKIKE